jgi:endonuclease YncB( thermonuclease family)
MGNSFCLPPKLNTSETQTECAIAPVIPAATSVSMSVSPVPTVPLTEDEEQPVQKKVMFDDTDVEKSSVRPSVKKNKAFLFDLKNTTEHNCQPDLTNNALSNTESTDLYKDCTDENTPCYSYENLKKTVKVLRVVDGDTVDIALYQDDTKKIYKYRVRLYGIDTPEKRPLKSNPNRDKEIEAAKQSSQAMIDKLKENDNIVVALFYKPDKYGRLLCTLYDKQGDDINQWMINGGYATPYFGKTKKSYDEVVASRTNLVL